MVVGTNLDGYRPICVLPLPILIRRWRIDVKSRRVSYTSQLHRYTSAQMKVGI
ncbi:MAG: hypothetical protein WBY47_15830 [Desulfobacterales bacterium]